MAKNTKYKDDSIISLDPREFTRLRPSTYLGDNSTSTQLVREVFANSLDEHNIGHGNIITVNIDTTKNEYIVEDNGQGFPINVTRDDGKTVLEASFSVLNTSGKYDDKDGVYGGVSLGLNGIGSKLTNFLSKSLDVLSFNDKGYEHIWFKDGLFVKRDTGEWKKGTSGTIVKWKPDPQFFQDVNANNHDLKAMFEAISALCPTLTINYKYDSEEKVFHSENGLQDLIDSKVKNKELFTNRFAIRKVAENNLFDIVLTYTSDYSDSITAYVNYGLTESGIHISTVRTLITKQINKYASDSNLLKKNDDAFTGPELSEGLVIVFNVKATNVKYDSQTKVRVVDIDKTLITTVLSNDFADWLNNNPKEAKIIIDRALNARKAKEAAQKAKDGVRNATTKGKKFLNLPTKLVDAYSKDRKDCELYLCLKGDTKIKLLDGTTPTIESLVGQSGLWCYSSNEYGSMIPTQIKKVFKTQEVSKLLKLTFDDGTSVECTPEHKFLDKETLTWVEAKDLTVNQSLCSMKFKTVNGYDFVYISHGQDYSIKQKTKGKYFHGLWEPVHIRTTRVLGLAHEYNGNTIYDIHHLDHNKQNNNPDNLLVCTKSEHAHIHNMENYESGEFQRRIDNMSTESRLRMQQGVYNRTDKGIQHQKDAVSQAWKDGRYANATFANFNNSEKRRVNGKDYTYKCKILKYAKSLLDRGFEITEDIWEEYRCKQQSKADARFAKALSYFDSIEQLVAEAKNYNLAVVSIEEVNYQVPIPVYCLDVENEFHSFVLANGLISHNCEGDSAGNGLVAKRDGKTQAIFPLRGKVLSCRKATMDKVYANQEIANIVRALGLDVDKNTGKLIYDAKKLRYSKIIVACFTGDTKIKALDGNLYSFKELVDNNIDHIWVYSMDEHGNIVPGKATNIRETRQTTELLKITLDSGAEIKCTPDHLFMKADGQYCRADELETFESLMPLYTKYIGDGDKLREYTFDRLTNRFRPTHQLIAEAVYDKALLCNEKNCDILNVHHKNRNKLDNSPENLVYLTPREHSLEHKDDDWHKTWGETYNKTQLHKDRIKELHDQGFYADTYFGSVKNGYNGSQKQKEDLRNNWASGVYANATFSTNGYNFSTKHSEVVANVNKSEVHINSVKRAATLKSIKYILMLGLDFNEYNYTFYKQASAAKYNDLCDLFGSFDKALEVAINYNCDLTNYKPKYEYSHYDHTLMQKNRIAKNIKALNGADFNEKNFNAIKGKRDVAYANILNWFNSYEEAYEYSKNYNHRVISIEHIYLEATEPVYCMSVEKYHNFALASGVFVKNCDADPDGYDIRLLLINALWWLCPELILNGHIYAAIPPLYRITTKKNEYVYLVDDNELNEYKKKHSKESFLINRNKGLGEQDASELAQCLLKPETRNVQQIIPSDFDTIDNLLEIFMGDKVQPRREYLLEHYNEVKVDIE